MRTFLRSKSREKPRWQLRIQAAFLFSLAFGTGNAFAAYEEGIAHIVVVQSQYMPTLVQFTADTGTTSCPAGKWLTFGSTSAPAAQVEAVFAAVLAGLNTGNKILYGINAGDTTCTILFLYSYATP